MGTETGTLGSAVALSDGRTLYLRHPREGDAAGVHALEGAPLAYFSRGREGASPGAIREATIAREASNPTLVLALEGGAIAAAAWLTQTEDDPSTGNFSVAIQPAFRHASLAPVMLRELAGEAARQGITRMGSCVGQGTRDPLNDCRCAGLPVLSALSFGGVTEIVLGATGVREAAMV